MSKSKPTNIAASIRQRLLNLARDRNEEFQLVLVRYGVERLLYRLSKSSHKNQFLLKGAMLFQLWTGQPHRSTLDLDLLGQGDDATARFEAIFKEVCTIAVEEDGLKFLPEEIHAEEIREDQRYAGVRVRGITMLGTAEIPLQIDIGFGDAVTPEPEQVQYPSLLDLPTPKLRAYPKETVVAEKYEAMVSLGMANSRMKDFYDVWMLAASFEFESAVLRRAIQATFERRGTILPTSPPLALTSDFSGNPTKKVQWQAFVRRAGAIKEAPSFEIVVELLADFLWPVTQPVIGNIKSVRKWPVGGLWQ